MALSFSRPDPSSPASVGSATFAPSRRGFDQTEVREFLRMVAAELARLQERERFLESELKAAQTNGMSAPGRLDEQTLIALLGEETARVLASAREASVQIRDRAEESATRMVKEASEDAIRIRQAAELEAKRIRDDASGDAIGEVELAKQQGREMVEEARAYREKVLAELARRRDAARTQIEQLMHGRDRLVAAFERARIAAQDVVKDVVQVDDDGDVLAGLPTFTSAVDPDPAPVATPESPAISPLDSESAPATVSPDHPSIVIFDHEAENHTPERRGTGTVVVADDTADSTLVVENVPRATSGIFDVVAEEQVDCGATSPSTQESDDDFVAPVVSIFGGRRRPQTPEVNDHVVSDDEPEIDESHVGTDAHTDEAELPDSTVVDLGTDEETRPSAGRQAIDEIFARLRASSPDVIAHDLNGDSNRDAHNDANDVVNNDANNVANDASGVSIRRVVAVTPVVEPARFTNRDAALAPMCEAITKKMKRALADELNAILEHLNTKKPKLGIEAMVSSTDDHVSRYVSSIADEILAAATEGAKSMKSSKGSVKRVDPRKVEQSVADMMLDTIVTPLRARLEQVLRECDGNTDDIADGVRAIYREWKMSRIDAHVADLACVAHSRGAFLSLEDGTQVCWMVDPNGPACADAEDNSLAGVVTCGEKFPTGHEHPLAHPGCRCLVCPTPK